MDPDVGVYQTTPDNNWILLNPAVPKLFRGWLKSEFGEHLATHASNSVAYVNMTKMLIVWMIFGSGLLSSFSMSTFYSFLKCLRYTANRHRPVWKITTQV